MIGRLNHVAIAVPDIISAAQKYKLLLGADTSEAIDLLDHGVKTIFVHLHNTKIELIEPLNIDSPITGFLNIRPDGGIHHICYEVKDINKACEKLKAKCARILGSQKPTIGAHGKPVIFLHPKDFNGTLIELEEM